MFLIGHWKSFGELEDSLSLPELVAVLDAHHKRTERQQRWDAALQGVDIGDSEGAVSSDFEQAWLDAMSEVRSEGSEKDSLAFVGIGYELDG